MRRTVSIESGAKKYANGRKRGFRGGSALWLMLFLCSRVEAASNIQGNEAAVAGSGIYKRSVHGPLNDPTFFPLAVWLQSPENAEKYKAIGINTYVALWQGPTEQQFEKLKRAGLRLVCEQNEVALRHLQDDTIIAWMHGDEPDNAQSLGARQGWGPPVSPEKIQKDYERLKAADPSRPVMLNLGQGVAWDGWYGRGSRSRHPEDYPEYIKGCDIASFDIYPAVHDNGEVAGKLWYVASGVVRLVGWSQGKKVVWNCIECTHIGNPDRKATPHELRAEAWMSLINGSRGLIYFVHQFKPNFREAALLDDPEMLKTVAKVNQEITALAPALNSSSVTNRVNFSSSNKDVPIAVTVKQAGGYTYVFAVDLRNDSTKAKFTFDRGFKAATVEVVGEDRKLPISEGGFSDDFGPWDVHLYRLR